LQPTVSENLGLLRRCFDHRAALQQVHGRIVFTLELDASGAVRGGASQPPAGQEGLARVAGCMLESIKEWRFAARRLPGATVVTIPLSLVESRDGRAAP
jgi:hypothetical protein